jgi:hypothetical protein
MHRRCAFTEREHKKAPCDRGSWLGSVFAFASSLGGERFNLLVEMFPMDWPEGPNDDRDEVAEFFDRFLDGDLTGGWGWILHVTPNRSGCTYSQADNWRRKPPPAFNAAAKCLSCVTALIRAHGLTRVHAPSEPAHPPKCKPKSNAH